MAGEASAQREKQEQSIKARKNELFVEEQQVPTGPRKKLRDYLRETPAAPLSRNVKLVLWGSAAPVVLLFLFTLLVLPSKRSRAKVTDELVIPVHVNKPAPNALASRTDNKPATAPEIKPHEPKPDAQAKSSSGNPSEKPKNKAKKKGKAKPKPKPETVVASSDEGAGPGTKKEDLKENEKGDKPKDSDQTKGMKTGSSKADASGSDTRDKEKGKTTASSDAKSKNADASKTNPSTSEKPKQRLFKQRKPYNPTYPKRTPTPEKKAEPGSNDPSSSNPSSP